MQPCFIHHKQRTCINMVMLCIWFVVWEFWTFYFSSFLKLVLSSDSHVTHPSVSSTMEFFSNLCFYFFMLFGSGVDWWGSIVIFHLMKRFVMHVGENLASIHLIILKFNSKVQGKSLPLTVEISVNTFRVVETEIITWSKSKTKFNLEPVDKIAVLFWVLTYVGLLLINFVIIF